MKSKFFIIATMSLLLMNSCKKDSTAPPVGPGGPTTTAFKAILTGSQEVPTHSSNASGTLDGSYNSSTMVFNYSITYKTVSGTTFNPTVAHIHKGLPGVDGNAVIAFDLGAVAASPHTGTIILTATQFADFKNGLYYVHIHSNIFPEGDIRGQIELK
ncbi:MAG: CHRD domain-containing protein [Ferruginibacter sp.]